MTNFPNLQPYLGSDKNGFVPADLTPTKSKAEIIKEATEIIESAKEIRDQARREDPYLVSFSA